MYSHTCNLLKGKRVGELGALLATSSPGAVQGASGLSFAPAESLFLQGDLPVYKVYIHTYGHRDTILGPIGVPIIMLEERCRGSNDAYI